MVAGNMTGNMVWNMAEGKNMTLGDFKVERQPTTALEEMKFDREVAKLERERLKFDVDSFWERWQREYQTRPLPPYPKERLEHRGRDKYGVDVFKVIPDRPKPSWGTFQPLFNYTVLEGRKSISAFRFAKKVMGLDVRRSAEWRKTTSGFELSIIGGGFQGGAVDMERGCVSLGSFNSLMFMNATLWHEIGHMIDAIDHGGVTSYNRLPRLYMEARASVLALQYMRKYGGHSPKVKEYLLKCYDTYKSAYPHQECCRSMIENETLRLT